MTRLVKHVLQTCHSESPSRAVLGRATQGPVNTPNIQSHRPVSPAVLFKQLLKLTVLQCQQPENDPSGAATALYAQWNPNAEREKEKKTGKGWRTGSVRGKQWMDEKLHAVAVVAPALLLLSTSWRIWLRDRPTQLRPIQPKCSYAPDLLSKPPKLDYWDPRSKA